MRALLLVTLLGCAADATPMKDYPCPTGGTQLTYQTFGAKFLDDNCNRCHSAQTGDRHGAPSSFRFDTLDEVQAHADRIFVRAATTNTTMPPGPDDPSADSREQLAEWLACGAP